MADMAIGYNIGKAKDLADDIQQKFKSLKSTIETNWGHVQSSLHSEWIGEDEVAYEVTITDRINNLYKNSAALAKTACEVIGELADDWTSFQKSNVLGDAAGAAATGASVGAAAAGNSSTLEAIRGTFSSLISDEEVVKPKAEELNENTNRGLKNENSATTIQGKVGEFVKQVQTKAQDLFDNIKSNNAFFGDQTTKIDSLISTTGTAIGEVTVAIKDLNDALEKLAGTAYTNASSAMEANVTTAESSVSKSTEELGATKWTG